MEMKFVCELRIHTHILASVCARSFSYYSPQSFIHLTFGVVWGDF